MSVGAGEERSTLVTFTSDSKPPALQILDLLPGQGFDELTAPSSYYHQPLVPKPRNAQHKPSAKRQGQRKAKAGGRLARAQASAVTEPVEKQEAVSQTAKQRRPRKPVRV